MHDYQVPKYPDNTRLLNILGTYLTLRQDIASNGLWVQSAVPIPKLGRVVFYAKINPDRLAYPNDQSVWSGAAQKNHDSHMHHAALFRYKLRRNEPFVQILDIRT